MVAYRVPEHHYQEQNVYFFIYFFLGFRLFHKEHEPTLHIYAAEYIFEHAFSDNIIYLLISHNKREPLYGACYLKIFYLRRCLTFFERNQYFW